MRHKKLIEAERLRDEAKRLEEEVAIEGQEEAKKLVPKYTYKVEEKVKHTSDHFSDMEMGTEYIVITSELFNRRDFIDHLEKYGRISNMPDEFTRSVNYYRISGVLLRDGGGTLILKDKQPCSDEEWEQIKTGDIPKKFLRR